MGFPEETRVAVFVGTRADLGPLAPLILALRDAPDIDLHLLTGVAYSATGLETALSAVSDHTGWQPLIRQVSRPIELVTADTIVEHGATMSLGTAARLNELKPDALVVLGDRWELLYVVPPAFLLGVRIVHLHGGEVTEGALDERVRHAVSKLADHHCVASSDAARRLARMGEPADRIHQTGAPGLDRFFRVAPLTDEELSTRLGADVRRPLALFTYHPPTAGLSGPVGEWALSALQATRQSCETVIATFPGIDPGRDEIVAMLEQAAADDAGIVLRETLGPDYPSVLASADVVVGNSSSGIIEAAACGVPAVNIGMRQQGRLRGENVIDTEEGREAVSVGVSHALSSSFRKLAANCSSPYGDGKATPRILDVVRNAGTWGTSKPFDNGEMGIGE